MTDTKQKILDTAERLIAEQGYSAISLRHIIAEAGVNLAAIHYHFGSKEDLLDEIIQRKIGPVNQERLARLDRVVQEAGDGPIAVEKVFEAFLVPMAEAADRAPAFVPFMGRLMAEGLMRTILQKHFEGVVTRTVAVLRRAVPDLPEEEFAWRMHFLSGTLAHTMCGAPHFPNLVAVEGDFRSRIGRLITFLSAGFRAPATASEAVSQPTESKSEEK
jgi:AcrR family transcriptional regulator